VTAHTIDLSRLQRRKPDMTVVDNRTEDEKVFSAVKSMLRESHPNYDGGVCLDKVNDSRWQTRSFKEKVEALHDDTIFWMHEYE
jgi:hypothetical protein